MLPGDIELSTQKRKENCIFPRYVTDDGTQVEFFNYHYFLCVVTAQTESIPFDSRIFDSPKWI